MKVSSDVLYTPDKRYIVVRARLWRAANPYLPEPVRHDFVQQLMAARREVQLAQQLNNQVRLRAARAAVQAAKVGLGERGPVWWDDGAPDYNRYLVKNTPYASWFKTLPVSL